MGNPNDTTDYIQSFIDNIYTVISNYKDFLGVRNITTTEDNFIPVFPSITIELDRMQEDWKEMPRRKTLSATFSIVYYSSNLNDRGGRQNLRSGLNKLANCLRENWDVNDYCPQLGSEILSITPYVFARNQEIVLGGEISFRCHKVITVTLV